MAKIDFKKLDTYRKTFDGILQVKKHVGLEDDLPVTGAQNGDMYTVGDSNTLYMFNNGEWGILGSGGATGCMVVYGTVGQDGNLLLFVPNDGQPTLSKAVEAFENGIPVILVVSRGETRMSSRVLCHSRVSGAVYLSAFFVEGYVHWKSDGNTASEPDPSPDPGPNPIQ